MFVLRWWVADKAKALKLVLCNMHANFPNRQAIDVVKNN